MAFLAHFYVQIFLAGHFDCTMKIAFRNSVSSWASICTTKFNLHATNSHNVSHTHKYHSVNYTQQTTTLVCCRTVYDIPRQIEHLQSAFCRAGVTKRGGWNLWLEPLAGTAGPLGLRLQTIKRDSDPKRHVTFKR